MRAIPPILAALTAFAVSSTQAAPNPNPENWYALRPALSFGLGDQACGDGRHQALWRDWRGDWWWGPCVQSR
jgi:hypothetical protein